MSRFDRRTAWFWEKVLECPLPPPAAQQKQCDPFSLSLSFYLYISATQSSPRNKYLTHKKQTHNSVGWKCVVGTGPQPLSLDAIMAAKKNIQPWRDTIMINGFAFCVLGRSFLAPSTLVGRESGARGKTHIKNASSVRKRRQQVCVCVPVRLRAGGSTSSPATPQRFTNLKQ